MNGKMSFAFSGWEVPITVSDEQLKEIAEEIAVEKRMCSNEVEPQLRHLLGRVKESVSLSNISPSSLLTEAYSGQRWIGTSQ